MESENHISAVLKNKTDSSFWSTLEPKTNPKYQFSLLLVSSIFPSCCSFTKGFSLYLFNIENTAWKKIVNHLIVFKNQSLKGKDLLYCTLLAPNSTKIHKAINLYLDASYLGMAIIKTTTITTNQTNKSLWGCRDLWMPTSFSVVTIEKRFSKASNQNYLIQVSISENQSEWI